MDIPIILTAFGTTSTARKTYDHIESSIRKNFPLHPLYWGYTSAVIRERLLKKKNLHVKHPTEILANISISGCRRAVVQSLHLFPGSEFHKLSRDVSRITSIQCSMGLPLLSSPEDYEKITTLLAPVIEPQQEQAVLVVGHGTSHHVWTAYLALEHFLQDRFGPHVFVGTVDHYPITDKLEDKIAAGGYRKVLMIPFFLTAGHHFRRDMMGKERGSWRNRLESRGLEVEALENGLGLLPGFDTLLVSHIQKALSVFDSQ